MISILENKWKIRLIDGILRVDGIYSGKSYFGRIDFDEALTTLKFRTLEDLKSALLSTRPEDVSIKLGETGFSKVTAVFSIYRKQSKVDHTREDLCYSIHLREHKLERVIIEQLAKQDPHLSKLFLECCQGFDDLKENFFHVFSRCSTRGIQEESFKFIVNQTEPGSNLSFESNLSIKFKYNGNRKEYL
jgi:hypothetical protein